MDDAYLIAKANQIAAFFTPYTDEEAVAGIADHLLKFWEPRMLAQLRQIAGKAKDLDPKVVMALNDPAFTA